MTQRSEIKGEKVRTGGGVVVGLRLHHNTLSRSRRSLIRVGRNQPKALDTRRTSPLARYENVLDNTLLDKFSSAGGKETTIRLGGSSETLPEIDFRSSEYRWSYVQLRPAYCWKHA